MKTTKSEIIKQADKIIKIFFMSLEEIKYKSKGKVVLIKNDDNAENLSVSIGYLSEEPLFTLSLDQANEDVYNYIITNIFMKLRDNKNAQYSVNLCFNIHIEENNIVTSARFKGVHIFLFANNYHKKLKYINMIKNDMTSENLVNLVRVHEQLANSANRISNINSKPKR